MSDDIAFKIQLGLILPKLKSQVSGELLTILRELVQVASAGHLDDDEPVAIEQVKDLFMKDLEILLDKEVFPIIEKELSPETTEPVDTAEENHTEEETEDTPEPE